MKRLFILVIFLSTLAIAASAQTTRIGGRQWKLLELNGSRVGTSNAYVEFDTAEKRVSGNAGCNRMFGGVEIHGRQIVFSNIATTRMACADPRIQGIETAFLAALKNVDRFRQSGNTLELSNRRRVVIRFVANQNSDHPGAVGLEDKKWVLESLGSGPVSKIGRTAFLAFDKAKASAGGNSSCNVFGGSYSAKGSTLKITEVMSTMRACIEDERMDIERQFLDALRETNRYKIQDDKLMLYRDDRLLLTMTGEAK